jgi:hypothetical protein
MFQTLIGTVKSSFVDNADGSWFAFQTLIGTVKREARRVARDYDFLNGFKPS